MGLLERCVMEHSRGMSFPLLGEDNDQLLGVILIKYELHLID